MALKIEVSGLILAGGAGSRVQGQDKGLLPWRGQPLVEQVADRLRPQVNHLFISCNRNLEFYQQIGDSLVRDDRTGFQGPLAGIEAVRAHLKSKYLIVVACDTPRLPSDLVERLLEPLVTNKEDAPRVSYANDGSRDQYLFAALHAPCLDSIPDYLDQGHRSVRGWYQMQRTVVVDFSEQADAFLNYNFLDKMDM